MWNGIYFTGPIKLLVIEPICKYNFVAPYGEKSGYKEKGRNRIGEADARAGAGAESYC